MVKILTRYFAGDPSLIKDITENARSDAPITQMAKNSLDGNSMVDDVRKRKAECALPEQVDTYLAVCMDSTLDERVKSVFKEGFLKEYIFKAQLDTYKTLCTDTTIDDKAKCVFKKAFLNSQFPEEAAAEETPAILPPNNKPYEIPTDGLVLHHLQSAFALEQNPSWEPIDEDVLYDAFFGVIPPEERVLVLEAMLADCSPGSGPVRKLSPWSIWQFEKLEWKVCREEFATSLQAFGGKYELHGGSKRFWKNLLPICEAAR
jgi:hypothetical protein